MTRYQGWWDSLRKCLCFWHPGLGEGLQLKWLRRPRRRHSQEEQSESPTTVRSRRRSLLKMGISEDNIGVTG